MTIYSAAAIQELHEAERRSEADLAELRLANAQLIDATAAMDIRSDQLEMLISREQGKAK